MEIIKVKKRDIKKGHDVTPDCDVAKIIRLTKHKYAISFQDDLTPIGFRSKAFSRFVKNEPSSIIEIRAHAEICLCCASFTEDLVLTLNTEDGDQYQINGADDLMRMELH